MDNTMVLRVAAKAVIVNEEGKVLILREANTYDEGTQIGRYGLPGGRLNPGETFEEGLHREVQEETGLTVELQYPIYVGEWHPVIKTIPHQIIAIFNVCKAKTHAVRLSSEHDEAAWIEPSAYADYDFMTPDDAVIARYAEWRNKI
jgi:8-oxo-dGTP diphosphatase